MRVREHSASRHIGGLRAIDSAELKRVLPSLAAPLDPIGAAMHSSSIFSIVNFLHLTDDAKARLAKFFVIESCSTMGAVAWNGDAMFYLGQVAAEIAKWPEREPNTSGRLRNVAFALSVVANPFAFASPPGALATVYLVHQLEFCFRGLSGTLTADGEWANANARRTVKRKLNKEFGARINDVGDAYRIMMLNTSVPAVSLLADLDREPFPGGIRGTTITTVGDRISFLRHPASHGPLADPSGEGIFYALVMTIMLYGSSLFPRV